ncbi:CapA family protein, partial [Vibrio cyclitrophicus 1F53]|uniref:CapA family protein n=1 Tax=Vibrio cyclitrophicus TaxID=47951 RepID=UPI00389CA167
MIENTNSIAFLGDYYPSSEINIKNENMFDTLVVNYESAPVWAFTPESKVIHFENKVNLLSYEPNVSEINKLSKSVYYSLANNHSLDAGDQFKLKALENFVGFKSGQSDYRKIKLCTQSKNINIHFFVEADTNAPKSKNFSFHSVSDGVEYIDDNAFNIAYIHWGEEEIDIPTESMINKAKRLVDLGFDLIINDDSTRNRE